MKRFQLMGTIPVLALTALVAIVGCAKKSPLEQMIENRSRYSAELNSFFVEETPLVSEVIGPETELEGEPTEEGGAEGEEMVAELGPVPVLQKVHLDVLVKHDSFEKLPGITVEITQVDAGMNQKGHWRFWVDTSNVERANPTSYSHVLEDAEYVEGDAFSVEVRHPVPEGDRGDYQEFANLG